MPDIADQPINPAQDETATETPATAEKPKREPKPPVEPHACLCRIYSLEDGDSTQTTGCQGTTKSTFAQGHDAQLVSFLVKGQLDGYGLFADTPEGARLQFTDAGHAAAFASEKLGVKADTALKNAGARREKSVATAAAREAQKAETAARNAAKKEEARVAREARKAEAAAAKIAGKVKVVEGSQEGDSPASRPEPEEGEEAITIKVGRHELPATLNAEKTEVRWIDTDGNLQTRPADAVRILAEQA